MSKLLSGVVDRRHFVLRKYFGGCTKCIRKSWLGMLFAMALSFLSVLGGWRELVVLFLAIAFSCAGLWVVHLAAFASKAGSRRSCAGPSARRDGLRAFSRRDTVGLFVRAVLLGAVISIAPRSALAQSLVLGSCQDQGCGSCSRPGYINGKFIGCVSCHSCGSGCWDSPGSALPNGC